MAYIFAKQSDVRQLNKWCMDVIHAVQKDLKEYFTFDIRIIGSGDKRLVTQNNNGSFDLDYNLILQKDKKNLLNNPKKIKELFMNSFNKIISERVQDYKKHISDSTSVITTSLILNNELYFSFDCAVVIEGNDNNFYRLTNDKNTNRYIWNVIPKSKNYYQKFLEIKKNGDWIQFKNRYLELKNMHLSRQNNIKSFSIFLETLNEF